MYAEELPQMTLKEFEAMEKDERLNYELIDGVVMMSPSPSREHQKIASNLHYALRTSLKNSRCETLYEYDVKANGNVFKPDLMVFCEENENLPIIIIEIISPTSKHRDLVTKVAKYEQAGIAEYWIADPKTQIITVHDFVNAETEIYTREDTIHSKAIPDIVIAAADIFG